MRKIRLVIFFFLIACDYSQAQLILNNQCQAFTETPFFNAEFIRKNKIKSIHGKTSSKRPNDIIRENDLIQYYEFDESGRLIKQMYSHNSFSYRTDTTTIIYSYDEKGRLLTKRQNDNFSFYSYNYQYDSLGNLVKETYNRDENCGSSKYNFKLGNTYEITSESFSYDNRDGVRIKRYFNNFGREYQYREYYNDKLNYLVSEKMFYSLTGRQTMEVTYEYNELGLCITKSERNTDGVKMTMTYDYDKQGNLTEYEQMADETVISHKELLYDKSTMLVSAVLSKEIRTDIITIVRYTYEFH